MTETVIAICGMHRSGTSLLSSWLQKCGLDIGDEMVPAQIENPMGFYEDREIKRFQNNILTENGFDYKLKEFKEFNLDRYKNNFEKIIEKRSHKRVWAWKDPRTTLFLDQWKSCLKEKLKLIAIYRDPNQVVESLFERDYRKASILHKIRLTLMKPNILKSYAKVWTFYNQCILDFANKYPNDILIIGLNNLPNSGKDFISLINKKWGLSLEELDLDVVYKKDALHMNSASFISINTDIWVELQSKDALLNLVNNESSRS